MFTNGGRPAGGMFKLTPEMAGVPAHWLVYFAVDDCDAKTQKATELGATTMKPADFDDRKKDCDTDYKPDAGKCEWRQIFEAELYEKPGRTPDETQEKPNQA